MNIDVIDRIRVAQPEHLSADAEQRANAELERFLATVAPPRPRRRSRAALVAVGVSTILAASAAVQSLVAGPASATDRVHQAATRTAGRGSGRATMTVERTTDGVVGSSTVSLAWSGDDESYVFDSGSSVVVFEVRVVDGVVYQRNPGAVWRAIEPTSAVATNEVNAGRLASIPDAFAQLTRGLRFEAVEQQENLTQFRAVGDLTPLDSTEAGFVFGTNGATNARTEGLDLWTDGQGQISKIRTSFTGDSAGHHIEAVATTTVTGLGTPVTIDVPKPRR